MPDLKATVAREIDKLAVVEAVNVAIHDKSGTLINSSQDEGMRAGDFYSRPNVITRYEKASWFRRVILRQKEKLLTQVIDTIVISLKRFPRSTLKSSCCYSATMSLKTCSPPAASAKPPSTSSTAFTIPAFPPTRGKAFPRATAPPANGSLPTWFTPPSLSPASITIETPEPSLMILAPLNVPA